MNTYNPYTAALSAAVSELTSENARRYYSLRSAQDIQTILVLIVQFGCMAYELGAAARQFMDDFENRKSVSDLVLANSTYTLNYQPVGNLPTLANLELCNYFTVECWPNRPTLALPPVRCAGLLMPAKSNSTYMTNLTIRELRKLAREQGIKSYSKLSKARLIELLSA
jgi:hypothetical protein